jgi:hypothetical protein
MNALLGQRNTGNGTANRTASAVMGRMTVCPMVVPGVLGAAGTEARIVLWGGLAVRTGSMLLRGFDLVSATSRMRNERGNEQVTPETIIALVAQGSNPAEPKNSERNYQDNLNQPNNPAEPVTRQKEGISLH